MSTNKVLIGGIVGGIVFFFLGWLIYGLALSSYMASHSNPALMKPMDQMIWWALILSNFGWGFLLAFILNWANVKGVGAGARIGMVFGLLLAISMDLGFYSMSTMYTGFGPVIVDILASIVMFTVGGAVIGWVLTKGKKVDLI